MDSTTKIKIDADIEKDLWEWLRKQGQNRARAARALGLKPHAFYRYLERQVSYIPLWVVIKISLGLGKDLKQAQLGYETDSNKKLPRSEQAKRVLADEQWSQKPSGRPKQLEPIKCHRDDTLMEKKDKKKKNRADDRLAKKYQFTSRFTMRIAILVVQKGCIELILALDQKSISFKSAAKLVQVPKPLQRQLLIQHKQDKQAILNYFKPPKTVEIPDRADIVMALKLMKEDPWIRQQKKATQQSIQKVFKKILYAASC